MNARRVSALTCTALMLMACRETSPDPDPDTSTDMPADGADGSADVPIDTSHDSADDSSVDPGSDDVPDEELPPVLDCIPVDGAPDRILLRGTILTPDTQIRDGEILVLGETSTTGAEHISCVGDVGDCASDPDAAGASVICTEGVIVPGFIDAHNHVHYNILPRWDHPGLQFEDRSEWQSNSSYRNFKDPYDELNAVYLCQMVKYSEARIAIAGGTSVQGCSGTRCIKPLVRNVEMSVETSGLGESNFWTRITSIDEMSTTTADNLIAELDSGETECFIPHIAEGVNELARAEFDTLGALDLMRPETTIIHGTGATTAELATMASAGMQIVWSPVSNIDLYGLTNRITVVHRLGINIALGPDWTPSGSRSVLEELKCIDHLNSTYYDNEFTYPDLVRMATSNGAEALHLEDHIGRLEPGLFADVTVIAGDRDHPWRTVVQAPTSDVRLVLRGGQLLYGEQDLAAPIAGPLCESMDVCGTGRTICVATSTSPTDGLDETLVDITNTLETALMTNRMLDPDWNPSDLGLTYEWELYDLYSCEPPPVCQLGTGSISGVPTTGDVDGDDEPDATDLCPDVFDPDQSDVDGDTVGDACDVCPLDADTTDCSGPAPSDADGDTIADSMDNCPTIGNPLQQDDDSDDRGNACDDCPDSYNPAPLSCPYTIAQIQDIDAAGHPAEGASVHLSSVTVTAVHTPGSDNIIWVQDPAGGPFSGIAIYLGSSSTAVTIGDIVDVDGVYEEFLGKTEISGATVAFVAAGTPLTGEVVAAADLATGGTLAEPYEGVLVTVTSVTVTDANPDAPSDYNEFAVTGDLRVDDLMFLITPDPIVDDTFTSLTGILDYAFYDHKLQPRASADVVY